ncbi:NAD(P)-binding protein [Martensiomyces pterosporus]|nr:NAD(P)-binding protein [Martensiomyces pterosporus]
MSTITRVLLNSYVQGGHAKLSDFKVVTAPAPSRDSLTGSQVLIRPLYYSVDPFQRGRLSGVKMSYIGSYVKDEPISNFTVASVVASAASDFKEGDTVFVRDGKWESEYVADAKDLVKAPLQDGITPRDYVGVLSMPSFTAYVGTVVLGKPKAGETILVSSAAGAVGQIVVQLAKARGLRVIGAAGSDDKVEYVKSLGADEAFNYKTSGDFVQAIKKVAPEGIDIYFDNVGGEFLDAALANISIHARVISCGAISQYNVSSHEDMYPIKNILSILLKKATIQGFSVSEYGNTKIRADFIDEVSTLYKQGKIQYRITEVVGIENGPQAILDLFEGKNFGKSIIKAREA